jgi:hypothetical protein
MLDEGVTKECQLTPPKIFASLASSTPARHRLRMAEGKRETSRNAAGGKRASQRLRSLRHLYEIVRRNRAMNLRTTTSYSLLLILISLPAAFGFIYVYLFGVNVLVRDEWLMTWLIDKWFSGTLAISDFWTQHNEHRLVLVRIVILLLATITHYNVKTEMYVTQTVFLTTLIIYFLAFYDSTRASKRAKLLLFVPISFLVFSPRQEETWLLGILVQFALVLMFSVLTLYLISLLAKRTSGYGIFASALTSATAATLTSSQGLLVWPVGLLQLLLIPVEKPAKKVVVGVWSLVGVAEWVLYFLDWTKPPNSTPSLLYALAHPLEGVGYFLTVLGGSFFKQESFAIVGGLVIAALIAVSLFLAYRNRTVADHSFWVALILFSFAILAAVTAARVGFGAQQALVSRYSSFSLLAVIGVYVLLAKLAFELKSFVAAVLVGILCVLLLVGLPISYVEGVQVGQRMQTNRGHDIYILSTWKDQPDEALKLLFPIPVDLRAKGWGAARILQRHDLNVFYEQQSQASLPPLSKLSPADAATKSRMQTINDIQVHRAPRVRGEPTVALPQEAQFVTVTGWAVDAWAKEAAGGVYIDVDGKIFPAYYGLERGDVAQVFKEPAYHYSGFEGSIRASKLGEGMHALSIVVLTSDKERYYGPHQKVDLEIK